MTLAYLLSIIVWQALEYNHRSQVPVGKDTLLLDHDVTQGKVAAYFFICSLVLPTILSYFRGKSLRREFVGEPLRESLFRASWCRQSLSASAIGALITAVPVGFYYFEVHGLGMAPFYFETTPTTWLYSVPILLLCSHTDVSKCTHLLLLPLFASALMGAILAVGGFRTRLGSVAWLLCIALAATNLCLARAARRRSSE